jgi:uncharacterized protein YbjT (DUF2867 family)
MIIAVTGATGNVGRKVTPLLLKMKGVQVHILTRDKEKTKHLAESGATVHEGDLADAEFVARATATADALFWVTPTPLEAEDLRVYQNHLGANAASAVVANRIGRVVNLSSIGAHIGHDTGPIDGLHDVEAHLDQAAITVDTKVTHLRPAFFMENFLLVAKPILEEGVVPLPVSGGRKVPMIATGDLAAESVLQLVLRDEHKDPIVPLHGPRDIEFDIAARTIGEALGSPVRHVRIDPDQARASFMAIGASEDVASRLVQMYESIENGHLKHKLPRTFASTTPTAFHRFCTAVLIPELRNSAAA